MRLAILLFLFTFTAHAQWEIEDSHTTASLRGIASVGDGVAWASGTNGTILRTEDDGNRWQLCTIPPGAEKLDFRGIQAFDAKTAIVMSSGKGDLSRLYKTTDGCQTWKLIFTNPDQEGFWDAIQFANRDFGVLLGDPVKHLFVVMITIDGGLNWERQTLRATEDINGETAFAASNSSLLVTNSNRHKFCTGGFSGPRVVQLSTGPTDMGTEVRRKLNWDPSLISERLQTSTHELSAGCFSMAVDHNGTTVGVGGDFTKPSSRKDTAWTTAFVNSSDNERFSFHRAQTPPSGYRSSVAYYSPKKLWITVGPNGTDISPDDGLNWTPLKPTKEDSTDADKNWNALSLPFVVGPNGRIGKLRLTALNP